MDIAFLVQMIRIRIGKWSASEEVENAEGWLEFEKILGYHHNNWAELGSIATQKIRQKALNVTGN